MEDTPAPAPPDLPSVDQLTDLDALTSTLVELGVSYGVRILGAIAVLLAAWWLSSWAARLAQDALKKTQTDGTVTTFVGTLVRWSLRVVGLVICLGVFGIEATSLAAILGGAGVAIGIALKGNLSNLASGLLLLAFRPFKDGDWIEVDFASGRVARLGLLQTELDDFDNTRHWIPNSQLIEQGLTNYDHHPYRRVDVPVGVAYDTDLQQATEVLRKVAEALTDDDYQEEPVVRAQGFGSSSIDFQVGIWRPAKQYWDARHRLILELKGALDEASIEIPFPQRDLHLRDAVSVPVSRPQAAK